MTKRLFFALSFLVTAALAQACSGPIECYQVTYGNCDTLVEARANARSEQEFRDLQQCYLENCAADDETDDGSDDAGDE